MNKYKIHRKQCGDFDMFVVSRRRWLFFWEECEVFFSRHNANKSVIERLRQ